MTAGTSGASPRTGPPDPENEEAARTRGGSIRKKTHFNDEQKFITEGRSLTSGRLAIVAPNLSVQIVAGFDAARAFLAECAQ